MPSPANTVDGNTGALPARVQNLSESGLSSLPPNYIQPPNLRADSSTRDNSTTIPVIDLTPSNSNILSQIRSACKHWGAFQVINHGVPSEVLDRMKQIGLDFFSLPMEEKLKYACDTNEAAAEGYGSQMLADRGGVLDWRDYFDHHTLPESRRDPSRWPDKPSDYWDVVIEYSNKMKELAQSMLSIISVTLGLPPLYIIEAIGEVHQNITISYYPSCPQPELALGLQAHSDMGAITLLIQDDVEGLEVLKDGKWVVAEPLTDAIIVILADQTEIISNGKYRSAEHRAIVNSEKPRLSISTFYDPPKDRRISPASALISRSPPKYKELMYGDYVSSWYGRGPEGKRNLDNLMI